MNVAKYVMKLEFRIFETTEQAIKNAIWQKMNEEALEELEKNKPFLCSGSCDEIYATTKLQNKTSLKYS